MFDFSATHWSQIHRLGERRPEGHEQARAWEKAWEHLTRKYRPAFRATARRCLERAGGRAVPTDHADDVVQAFLQACLDKGWFQRAAPAYGQFRAFAFTMLRRFAFKYVESAQAQKRWPKAGQLSLSDVLPSQEPGRDDPHDEESLYDWVRCVIEASTERVRARSPDNAEALWLLLQNEGATNVELARQLGWPASKFALARHRGLRMLREEIRNEVTETVRSSTAADAELSLLTPFVGAHIKDLQAGRG